MRPLTADQLLEVWENTWNKSPLERSIHLINAASSHSDLNRIAHYSIGERDARLLLLRKWMFGNRLSNLSNCPSCAEKVEWEMNVEEISLQNLREGTNKEVFELDHDDFQIKYRLINSLDMLNKNFTDARSLINNCIVEVRKGNEEFEKVDLPDTIYSAIEREMYQADPQAHIGISLDCPSCEHAWSASFSIMQYIWIEIEVWAKHLLRDIYLIAKNFGWSERDILNMNPNRRQLYLQMIDK